MATKDELVKEKLRNYLPAVEASGTPKPAYMDMGSLTAGIGSKDRAGEYTDRTKDGEPAVSVAIDLMNKDIEDKLNIVKRKLSPEVYEKATPEQIAGLTSILHGSKQDSALKVVDAFNKGDMQEVSRLMNAYSKYARDTKQGGVADRRDLEAGLITGVKDFGIIDEFIKPFTNTPIYKELNKTTAPQALTGLQSQFNLGSTIPGYGEAIGKQQALGGMQTKPLLSIPGQSEAMKTQNIIKGTDPSTLSLPKPEGLPIGPRGATKTLASAIYKEPVKEITTDFPPTPPPTAAPVEPPPPQAPSIGPEVVEATESNTTKTLKSLSSAFDGTAYQKQTDDLNSDITKMFSDFKQFTNAAQDDFQKEKVQQQWLEVGEKFAQALIQMGAGYYGMKKGVDMSGIKFNPTDWSRKLEESRADLKQSLSMARQTLEDEVGLKTSAKVDLEKDMIRTERKEDKEAAAAARVRDYIEKMNEKQLLRAENEFTNLFSQAELLRSGSDAQKKTAQSKIVGALRQQPKLLEAAKETWLFGLIRGDDVDPDKAVTALQRLQEQVRTRLGYYKTE